MRFFVFRNRKKQVSAGFGDLNKPSLKIVKYVTRVAVFKFAKCRSLVV